MTGSASAQTVTIATPPYASPPAPTTDVAVFSEAPSGSLSFAGTLDLLAANNHNLMKFRREEERRVEGQIAARDLPVAPQHPCDRGWRVSTASGAEEGLRMAREDPPDVVLLDLMMPERGGLSTLVELRKDDRLRSARVVIITGIDQEVRNIYGKDEHFDDSLSRARKFRADAYLEKPVDPDELISTLEELLDTVGAESL